MAAMRGWSPANSRGAGVRVRVAEVSPPRTPDAIAEREAASAVLTHAVPDGSEGVIVDGLLGTGAHGAPHGEIADAIGRIDFARSAGAGGRARGGARHSERHRCHHRRRRPARTCARISPSTFGAMKRGLLVNRDAAGAIVVVDIGLGAGAAHPATPCRSWTPQWCATPCRRSPRPRTRERASGSRSSAGRAGWRGRSMLAARGAMRSGIGMVKLFVAAESIRRGAGGGAGAMAARWPQTRRGVQGAATTGRTCCCIGPGLGARRVGARASPSACCAGGAGPVVLDADGLNAFAGDAVAGRLAQGAPRSHHAACRWSSRGSPASRRTR